MGDYENCMNVLLMRAGMIAMTLQMGDKEKADKMYNESIKWFKKYYELKRK